jgi:phage tail sheath protein FI
MGFQVSPGVEIKEFDLTAIVPAVTTTPAGFVGAFEWGPTEQRVLINSEKTLRETFFKPSRNEFYSTSWFVAQNFLTYGSNLLVGRVLLDNDTNAFCPGSNWRDASGNVTIPSGESVLIKNRQDFEELYGEKIKGTWDFTFAAKYPGLLGNGIKVIVYDIKEDQFDRDNLSSTVWGQRSIDPEDADIIIGYVNKQAPNTSSYAANILADAEDEIHVVVVDSLGKITGSKNTVLETYLGLSKAPSAKNPDGSTNYWRNVINNKSLYIWAGESPYLEEVAELDPSEPNQVDKPISGGVASSGKPPLQFYGAITGEKAQKIGENYNLILSATTGHIDWDEEVSISFPYDRCGIMVHELDYGTLTSVVTSGDRMDAEANVAATFEQLFGDTEEVDVSLLIAGDLRNEVNNNTIIALAEKRKDCVTFVSPSTSAIIEAAPADRANIVLSYRNGTDGYVGITSSSYAVMDSGPKYQYDRYNDRFIYVPMCGDIAGCCVRTDTTRDPWYSPAGYDRGRINNIVKLVYNPNKEERDLLYQKGVNPVVTFQGSGAILFGDKTLQLKASAFDRINVRRLFIVLEKAIATAAKFQLFEFNDAFTRNQFRQLVEPFLRDVQGRRGISSYAVVCDESNNPPSIIDSNQFVADIFVAPARSINFIKLNFVATPTGIQFAEFGG